MTVNSATMNNFVYVGNANVPTAGGGTVLEMEFTASSADFSGVTTTITEDGNTATETDGSFTASGVTMYATQLTGTVTLLGLPTVQLTFTPSNAMELFATDGFTGLAGITMTGVTADQTILIAGQAQKTDVSASA
jgi:hypothetical protein